MILLAPDPETEGRAARLPLHHRWTLRANFCYTLALCVFVLGQVLTTAYYLSQRAQVLLPETTGGEVVMRLLLLVAALAALGHCLEFPDRDTLNDTLYSSETEPLCYQ